MEGYGPDSSGSEQASVAGCCESDNENFVCIIHTVQIFQKIYPPAIFFD